MKAQPSRLVSPFFVPGTPVAAIDFRFNHSASAVGLRARRLRGGFPTASLSDHFNAIAGALVDVDPRLFARVEARSRARFLRGTRLIRSKH